MSGPIRVGVVGTGSLGQHHVRILSEMPEADLIGIHDADGERAAEIAGRHGVTAFATMEELTERTEAIVLAVPTVLHAGIGGELLERGQHVLVEKPITTTVAEADGLIARQGGSVLAAGHVEFYNPAVQALLAHRGKARFIVVERLSAFTARSLDIDVVLDLMIHDLQILLALEPSPLVDVRAVGVAVLSPKIDIANARLEFASGCVANVTASRISADRVRTLRAFLDDCYLSLDYAEQSVTGFRLDRTDAGADDDPASRIRPIEVGISGSEPLRLELEAFLAACRGDAVDYVDGRRGREALACAHRVLESISAG